MQDEQNKNVDVDSNYIEQIKKMKETMVLKEEYDKVVSDNKILVESLINGNEPQAKNTSIEKPNKDEIKKTLFGEEQVSNLTFCENALKLRKAIMDDGGIDPFLPVGEKIIPTEEDVECANRLASVLQECIDVADGDSVIFTNELQRRIK